MVETAEGWHTRCVMVVVVVIIILLTQIILATTIMLSALSLPPSLPFCSIDANLVREFIWT